MQVDAQRAVAAQHANISLSDSDNELNQKSSGPSSVQSNHATREMTDEERALLEDSGASYDVDLSRLYTLEVKGTLCFVGLKVHPLSRFLACGFSLHIAFHRIYHTPIVSGVWHGAFLLHADKS